MERFGFIHGELDTKLLILFVLRRLPRPVDMNTLAELCFCDGGVGWFEYSDCLAALVDNGHIEKLPGGRYLITEKGSRNGETVESSLPYSVRKKAEKLIRPVAEQMRRDAMIVTEHVPQGEAFMVTLALSDEQGTILKVELRAASEAEAVQLEQRFRRQAELNTGRIVNLLMDGATEK
jgi:hypothetical protein